MSELPPGVEPAVAAEPRLSASGILLRRDGDRWRVLLGLRARRSRFMPGHLAFPGGGLEPQDGVADDAGFRRCVSREIQEETGIAIAPDGWKAAGERTTPAIFPVRFRTCFYVAELPAGVRSMPEPPTGENERFELADPAEAIEAWAGGEVKVPPPVLPVLRAIAHRPASDVGALADAVTRTNSIEETHPRIEFVPGVWMLPQRTETLPPATHTNVWIAGGSRFVVVDPGSDDDGEVERLAGVVERRRAEGGLPVGVLLTHGHRDHVAGAGSVAKRLGVPVLAHEATLESLDLPGEVDGQSVADGEEIDLGGESLVAWHTPGHHPGHLVFHDRSRNVLFTGDLVSGLSTILIDPATGEMEAFLASLARAHALGCTTLLPGHGPPLPGKALERVRVHRLQREQRIVECMRAGASSLREIGSAAYEDVPEAPAALCDRQALAHLLKLEREGRAAQLDGRWSLRDDRVARIREILEAALRPVTLEVEDDSAKHVGHAGAASGGGHYRVTIVSAAFDGRSRVEQHRRVYEALKPMLDAGQIHALGLETRSASETG